MTDEQKFKVNQIIYWKNKIYDIGSFIATTNAIKLKDVLKAEYSTKILSFDNYGGNLNLLHPIASISLVGNGFKYFYQDEYEDWLVPQDADGIDTEDRILFAIGKFEEIVKRHYASQA